MTEQTSATIDAARARLSEIRRKEAILRKKLSADGSLDSSDRARLAAIATKIEMAETRVADLRAGLASGEGASDLRDRYEAERAALDRRVAAARGARVGGEGIETRLAQIETNLVGIDTDAGRGDFAAALDGVAATAAEMDALEAEIARASDAEATYVQGLGPLDAALARARAISHPELAREVAKLGPRVAEMQARAAADDFADALARQEAILSEIGRIEAAATEQDRLRAEAEAMRREVNRRLAQATRSLPRGLESRLASLKEEYARIDGLFAAGRYADAMDALQAFALLLDDFVAAREDAEDRAAYEAYERALRPRLTEASVSRYPALIDRQDALAKAEAEMERRAKAGDYVGAYNQALEVERRLAACEAALVSVEELRADFERAQGDVMAAIAEAFTLGEEGYTLQQLRADIEALVTQMERSAEARQYETAMYEAEMVRDKLRAVYAAKHDTLALQAEEVRVFTNSIVNPAMNSFAIPVIMASNAFNTWVKAELKKDDPPSLIYDLAGMAATYIGVANPVAGAALSLAAGSTKLIMEGLDKKRDGDAKANADKLNSNLRNLAQRYKNTFRHDFSQWLLKNQPGKYDALAEYVVNGNTRQAEDYLYALGLPENDSGRGNKLLKGLTRDFLRWRAQDDGDDPDDPEIRAKIEERSGKIADERFTDERMELNDF